MIQIRDQLIDNFSVQFSIR